jgi:peptide/nickel transport system ATP-binding protein
VELANKDDLYADPRHPYTVALLSAIPTTEVDKPDDAIILEGSIPSPINPPTGCKFHTRCFMAQEKCKRVPPEAIEVEPGHFVACHFPEKKLNEDGAYTFEMKKD